MSTPESSCQLCAAARKHDSDLAYDEILQEAREHLNFLTAAVFPTHAGLKEDMRQCLQDKCINNEKYILYNKIAYFSMKSIETRHANMAVMKRIERKKIKLMEKTILANKKAAELKYLQNGKLRLEDDIRTQNLIGKSLDQLNKSLLFPLLDHSRLRLVINSFLKFPIVCQVDARRPLHDSHKKSNKRQYKKESLTLSGVSSILGVPLPDSGDYTLVPPHVVCSALGHVAHLLTHLGKVLNIPLPHQLLPFDTYDFAVIKPFGNLTRHIPLTPAFKPAPGLHIPPSAAVSAALSLAPDPSQQATTDIHSQSSIPLTPSQAAEVFSSPFFLPSTSVQQSSDARNLPWKHSQRLSEMGLDMYESKSRSILSNSTQPNDMDFEDIGRHIHQENILQAQLENSGMNWTPNPDFASGLILLQANIIHLCTAVGMKPESLWPPQALLLNIFLLHRFCLDKTMTNETCATAMTPPEGRNKRSNDFTRLGKSLKAYCEVIQAKSTKNQTNAKSHYMENAKNTDILHQRLLAASRERNRKNVESSFYTFDAKKFERYDDTGNVSTNGNEQMSLTELDDESEGDEDNDLVHISFDYIESDDDSMEYQYSTDSSVLGLGFAFEEESFEGEIDDDLMI